jgi:hypothetical protein
LYLSVFGYVYIVIEVQKGLILYMPKDSKGCHDEKQTDQEFQTMAAERPSFCTPWFALPSLLSGDLVLRFKF